MRTVYESRLEEVGEGEDLDGFHEDLLYDLCREAHFDGLAGHVKAKFKLRSE